jgi:structure-specific recognition protein 1
MTEVLWSYNNISLATPTALLSGSLSIVKDGIKWSDSKTETRIKLSSTQIKKVAWILTAWGGLLYLINIGKSYNFIGFDTADLLNLHNQFKHLNIEITEKEHAISGYNFGDAFLFGSSLELVFDKKTAALIPILEMCQVHLVGDDLQIDMSTVESQNEIDTLSEVILHFSPISKKNDLETEKCVSYACVLCESINRELLDTTNPKECIIGEFESVSVLMPRGNYKIILYLSHLCLMSSKEIYVRYSSIDHIYILPKIPLKYTSVIITLVKPFKKGQTLHSFLLIQFPTEENLEVFLNINKELIEERKNKHQRTLRSHLTGSSFDVFVEALSGLSSVKVTKPRIFRSVISKGYSIYCLYKSSRGYLFPLEKVLIFIENPTLFLPFKEILMVKFTNENKNSIQSTDTFNFNVQLKSGTLHTFRSIPNEERSNLIDYIEAKGIHISELQQARSDPEASSVNEEEFDGLSEIEEEVYT